MEDTKIMLQKNTNCVIIKTMYIFRHNVCQSIRCRKTGEVIYYEIKRRPPYGIQQENNP